MINRFAWIILVLLLAACTRRAGNYMTIPETQPSEVIDHPAIVVYSPVNVPLSQQTVDVLTIKQRISGQKIPVVTTVNENLEFVKQNGDHIALNIKRLPENYNIILFNSVSNPVPCSATDLLKVVRNVFGEQSSIDNQLHKRAIKRQVKQQTFPIKEMPEQFTETKPREKVPVCRMKRITIPVADTSTLAFLPFDVPGIVFIENLVDTRTSIILTFENDLITWNNTDRYFTNGITAELHSPRIMRLSVARTMLPYRHKAFSSTSLLLVQNMYTSADTRIPPTLVNDRPFASYIYLGIRKINADNSRKLRLSSTLYAGVIGPYSAGSFFQTLVHKTFPTNDIPQGWETQINTDVILNYDIQLEKSLFDAGNMSLSALADIKTGTLYNNAGGGFLAQFGYSEPRFGYSQKVKRMKWQAYIYAQAEGKVIAYDATLQGGLINKNNIYTLNSSQLNHFIGNADIGLHFDYKGIGFEVAQHFLTAEFKQGLSQRWGQFSLLFPL